MLCMDVFARTDPPRVPRCVMDRFVPKLPLFGSLASRVGCVQGVAGNIGRLLEAGEICLTFPEGLPAIGKPLRERYQLREWRVGHAELALRYRVPVLPVAIIGSEEQWPQIGRIRGFHAFGAPYLPIVATPLPLPVHYRIHYGTPLDLAALAGVTERDQPCHLSSETIARAAAATRAAVERLLEHGLAERRGIFR